MVQVYSFRQIGEASPYMNALVISHIVEGQIESFESFPDFDIIAFDWYDINHSGAKAPQIIIYLDADNLLFFCEDNRARQKVKEILRIETDKRELDNQLLPYRFFVRLLKDDMKHLDSTEADDCICRLTNGSITGSLAGREEEYSITASAGFGRNNLRSVQRPGEEKSLDFRVENGGIQVRFLG